MFSPAHQFLASADAHAERRALEAAAHEARARASAEISDQVTRNIAMLFRAQEAREAHLADLERLNALVREMPDGHQLTGASDRVQGAFERAKAQGNFSALEALERELDRDRDEEEQAVLLMLLH